MARTSPRPAKGWTRLPFPRIIVRSRAAPLSDLALPLTTYLFRPGFIRPRAGAPSKTRLYRALYAVLGPLYPVLARIAPTHVTTSENMGRAMIAVADDGYRMRVLENADINAAAGAA